MEEMKYGRNVNSRPYPVGSCGSGGVEARVLVWLAPGRDAGVDKDLPLRADATLP